METASPWNVFAPVTPRVLVFPVGKISESTFNGILSEIRGSLKGVTVDKLGLGPSTHPLFQRSEPQAPLNVDLDFVPVTNNFIYQYFLTQLSWDKIRGTISTAPSLTRVPIAARASPTPLDDTSTMNNRELVNSFLKPYFDLYGYDYNSNTTVAESSPFPPSLEVLADEQLFTSRNCVYAIGLGLAPKRKINDGSSSKGGGCGEDVKNSTVGKNEEHSDNNDNNCNSNDEDSVPLEDLLTAFMSISRFENHKSYYSDGKDDARGKNSLTLLQLYDLTGLKLVLYDRYNTPTKGLPNYLHFITPGVDNEGIIPLVSKIYGEIASKGGKLWDALTSLKKIGKFTFTVKGLYREDKNDTKNSANSSEKGINQPQSPNYFNIPKEGFYICDVADFKPVSEPVNVLNYLSQGEEEFNDEGSSIGGADRGCSREDSTSHSYYSVEKQSSEHEQIRKRDRIGRSIKGGVLRGLGKHEYSSSSFSNSFDQNDFDSVESQSSQQRHHSISRKLKRESSISDVFSKMGRQLRIKTKIRNKDSSEHSLDLYSAHAGKHLSLKDTRFGKISLENLVPLSANDYVSSFEESSQYGFHSHSRTASKTLLHNNEWNGSDYIINEKTVGFRITKLFADCLLLFGYIEEAVEIYRQLISSPIGSTFSDQLWLGATYESLACAIALPCCVLSKCPRYTGKFTLRDMSVDAANEIGHLARDAEALYRGKLMIAHTRSLFIKLIARSWVFEQDDGTSEVKYLPRSISLTSVNDCFTRHLVEPSNYLWCAIHRLSKDKAEIMKIFSPVENEGNIPEPLSPTLESYTTFLMMIDNCMTICPRKGGTLYASEFASPYLYRLALIAMQHENFFFSETLAALMVMKLSNPGTLDERMSGKFDALVCQKIKSGDIFIDDMNFLFPSFYPFTSANVLLKNNKHLNNSGKKQSAKLLLSKLISKYSNNVPGTHNVFSHIASQLMLSMISLVSPGTCSDEYDNNNWDNLEFMKSTNLTNRLFMLAKMNGIDINNKGQYYISNKLVQSGFKDRTTDKRKTRRRDSISGSPISRHHSVESSPKSLSRSNSRSCSRSETNSPMASQTNSRSCSRQRSQTPIKRKGKKFIEPLILPFLAKVKLNATNPYITLREDAMEQIRSVPETDDPDNPFLYCDFADNNKKKGKNKNIIYPIGLHEHVDVTLSLKGQNSLMNKYIKNSIFEVNYIEGSVFDKDNKDENRRVFFYSLPNKFTLKRNVKIRMMLFLENADEYLSLLYEDKYIQLKYIKGYCEGDEVIIDITSAVNSCICYCPVSSPYINIINTSYLNRVGIRGVGIDRGSISSFRDYIDTFKKYIQPVYRNLPIHLACELPTKTEVETPFCDINYNKNRFHLNNGQDNVELCNKIDSSMYEKNGNENKSIFPAPLLIGLTLSISSNVEELEYIPIVTDEEIDNNGPEQDSEVKLSYCCSSSSTDCILLDSEDYLIHKNKIKNPTGVITLWFEIWNKYSREERNKMEKRSENDNFSLLNENATKEKRKDKELVSKFKNDDKRRYSIRIKLVARSMFAERTYILTHYWSCGTHSRCSIDNISLEGAQIPLYHLPPSAVFNVNVIPSERNSWIDEKEDNSTKCTNFFVSLSVCNNTSEPVSLISSDDFISVDSLAPNSVDKCVIVVKEDELYGITPIKKTGIVYKMLNMENEEEIGLYWIGKDNIPHTFAKQMNEVLGKNMYKNLDVLRKMVEQLYPRIKLITVFNTENKNDAIINIDMSRRIFSSVLTDNTLFGTESNVKDSIKLKIDILLQSKEKCEHMILRIEDAEGLYEYKNPVTIEEGCKAVSIEITLVNFHEERSLFIYVEDAKAMLCRTAFEWMFH